MADFTNMDKLEQIFAMQNMLDEDIRQRRGLNDKFTPEEWIQKKILATLSELSELLDEVNFKWWKNHKELNYDLIKGELTDILHFFVSMCLTAGMSAEELYNYYVDKNKENFDRQNGLSKKQGYNILDTKQ